MTTTPNTPAGGAVALLPCPFCGCVAHMESRKGYLGMWFAARCSGELCLATVEGVGTPEKAAEIWNHRSAAVPLDAVRGLVAKWRAEAGDMSVGLDDFAGQLRTCADELEALTRGGK